MSITRRNLFRAVAATGVAAVVGVDPSITLPPEFFDVAVSRNAMGKRGHVTAAEVFARVSEGHDYPATVPFPIEALRPI